MGAKKTGKKGVKRVTMAEAIGRVSTAQFIKTAIAKGKLTDEQILAAARKRPEAKGQKIGDHYVSWYRWQAKKEAKTGTAGKRTAHA